MRCAARQRDAAVSGICAPASDAARRARRSTSKPRAASSRASRAARSASSGGASPAPIHAMPAVAKRAQTIQHERERRDVSPPRHVPPRAARRRRSGATSPTNASVRCRFACAGARPPVAHDDRRREPGQRGARWRIRPEREEHPRVAWIRGIGPRGDGAAPALHRSSLVRAARALQRAVPGRLTGASQYRNTPGRAWRRSGIARNRRGATRAIHAKRRRPPPSSPTIQRPCLP